MKRTAMGTAALATLGLALGACTSAAPKRATPTATRSATTATRSAPAAPSASATGSAVPGRLEVIARLHAGAAYPGAAGVSEYDQEGSQRELEVTLARVPQLAGKRVTVFVNGSRAGSVTVSAAGRAHGDWDTAHGDSVPHAAPGSRAEVRTAAGTVVVSGSYAREPED